MAVISIGKSPLLEYCAGHSHSIWEIVLNLEGSGRMIIEEKEYPYEPGTIICQPPDMTHIKYSEGFFRDIYIQVSDFTLSGPSGGREAIVFKDDGEKSFEGLMMMAHRIFHRKENNYKSILEPLYSAMEQLLAGWYQYAHEDVRIADIKNRLVNSFTDPEISISGLLSECGYCNDHARRIFKNETGVTPLEYLTELRLNYAKRLMRENRRLNYSVSEISLMAGFYDSGYFSRLFRKKTGFTPSQYIEKSLKSPFIETQR